MNIALLKERIRIEKNSVEVDSIGNHKIVWSPYYSCYATVSGESPLEQTNSGAVWDESKVSFTIRFSKEVVALSSLGFRVIFRDSIYEIEGIDHMNYKKKSIKLHCKRCER
jgi:putative phage head-tail adaptor|nr:MAG TPA: Putative head tail adaptor [Caudoviricetes sp.]